MNETARANRLHIGIFGTVNSGKSSLINALTKQDIAIVSKQRGTTTDPIYKAMEMHGIGPVVFIDTPGFNDQSELGKKRILKTKEAMDKTDIAIVLLADNHYDEVQEAIKLIQYFQNKKISVLPIINKIDILENVNELSKTIEENCQCTPIQISALTGQGIETIQNALLRFFPEDFEALGITQGLCHEGDLVLLVMPQDIAAPKGRLILPQVQTMRELLDKKCSIISCTCDCLEQSLAALNKIPNLIICDSQVFKTVYEKKPKQSKLTSFSILFANYKGDIHTFIKGADKIAQLHRNSRVLIVEACTHVPLSEDIGRVKIPALLHKKVGEQLQIDIISGMDFPANLNEYDLIIHCGGCMFNRRYVMNRIEKAIKAKVAITNYGICLAYLNGILDKVAIPSKDY